MCNISDEVIDACEECIKAGTLRSCHDMIVSLYRYNDTINISILSGSIIYADYVYLNGVMLNYIPVYLIAIEALVKCKQSQCI